MTALRVFPFIGAVIAIAAVVLAIIGVSTTYWFSPGVGVHSGRMNILLLSSQIFFFVRSLANLYKQYLCIKKGWTTSSFSDYRMNTE